MAGISRFFLFLLCLLPWLVLQPQIRISGDAAWLIHAADLFLSGHRMTEFFFDNNPPLSYMIYAPVALLAWAGVPAWYVLPFLTMALAGVSLFLTARFLRAWPGLGAAQFWGLLAAFAAAVTLPAQLEWGQKDNLIVLTLFPFLLAQFAMTYKHDTPRWVTRTALVLGVPFLLLKPHYGLLPVLMLVHRAWREKKFSVAFDFDFWALAAGVVLYAAAIWFWFPDFISGALDKSLGLYVFAVNSRVFKAAFGLMILAACSLTMVLFAQDEGVRKKGAVFLSSMALASTLPFLLQLKGFSLHMLPAISLLAPALFMTISLAAEDFFKKIISPLLVILTVFGAGYLAFPPFFSAPSHADYIRSPLAEYVRGHAAGCRFFIQADTANITGAIALYTGIPQASRFPSLWFMEGLARARPERQKELRKMFAHDMVEDFQRGEPCLVALKTNPSKSENLLVLMREDPAFKKLWSRYRKAGQGRLDYGHYHAGSRSENLPMEIFDIYVPVRR